jgi:endonuclease YncB( thermonuclease family)
VSRLGLRGLGTLVFAGLAVGGVAMATLHHGTAPPAASATATPQELAAPPTQVAVVDGGTLRLGEHVVRLSGVKPPARGTPCGSGLDCAAAAMDALAAMVREFPVACQVTGKDTLGRPLAVCEASGTELNWAVIAAGWARADEQQPALRQAEAAARAQHRGVWASASAASW